MSEIQDIKKKIDDMEPVLKEIHTAVAGNDKYGQKGMKHLLDEHEERISQVEKTQASDWKKTAKVAGASAGLGASMGVLFPKAILAKIWALISSMF